MTRFTLETLIAGLLSLSGCAQFDMRKAIPWTKGGDGELEQPMKVVCVWTDTIMSHASEVPRRGFGGRLMFYADEEGKPVKVTGSLTVYAFDETDRVKVEALVARMEAEMRSAAKELEFERAAALRDEIQQIRLRVLEQDASVTVARAAERAARGDGAGFLSTASACSVASVPAASTAAIGSNRRVEDMGSPGSCGSPEHTVPPARRAVLQQRIGIADSVRRRARG